MICPSSLPSPIEDEGHGTSSSGTADGPVPRHVPPCPHPSGGDGHLRRRTIQAIDLGMVDLEPGVEGAGIALALRWSSSTTALRYARELAVGSNAAARVLGKLRAAAASASG